MQSHVSKPSERRCSELILHGLLLTTRFFLFGALLLRGLCFRLSFRPPGCFNLHIPSDVRHRLLDRRVQVDLDPERLQYVEVVNELLFCAGLQAFELPLALSDGKLSLFNYCIVLFFACARGFQRWQLFTLDLLEFHVRLGHE